MKTDQYPTTTPAVFLQTVSTAVALLKQQLQQVYEQAYPELREVIHLVLDEEESNAWKLTLFPHLLFPDLVEAHIERLHLQPADTTHDSVFVPHGFKTINPPLPSYSVPSNYPPVLALCGS